jgi:hypothetical protein
MTELTSMQKVLIRVARLSTPDELPKDFYTYCKHIWKAFNLGQDCRQLSIEQKEQEKEEESEMTTVWRITLDRYSDESRAKSCDGKVYSVVETAELLIQKYKDSKYKPKIEVVIIGIGAALSDYLTDKKIPHTEVNGLISRIGSADVLKCKEV